MPSRILPPSRSSLVRTSLGWRVGAGVAFAVGCNGGEPGWSDTDPGAVHVGGQDFSVLDRYLDERLEDSLSGFAMQVVDQEGRVVYRREAGRCESSMCPSGDPEFTVDLMTGIASSSKWVTSTVVLAALDEGVAAGRWESIGAGLDSLVVPDLGCGEVSGPVTQVSLRQLLSFTSGVIADHDCAKSKATLHDCACEILRDSAAAMTTDTSPQTRKDDAHPPGTTYKYGASHLAIAGAWLERAYGESWDELFERLVRAPLGVEMEYVRAANLAGSMRTSVADYTLFVDALRTDAQGAQPPRLLSVEAATEQRAVQARYSDPSLAWLLTPQTGLDYGLNVWRMCLREYTADEALGSTETLQDLIDPDCDEVYLYGHGGKGGYTPFIDGQGRYAAVFAMREDSPGGGADYTDEEQALTARVRMLVHLAMTE
jgi:CubicO group peptidase (beta-lactamase class C family)